MGVWLGFNHFHRPPSYVLLSQVRTHSAGHWSWAFLGLISHQYCSWRPRGPLPLLCQVCDPSFQKSEDALLCWGPPPTLLYLVFPCFLILEVFWEDDDLHRISPAVILIASLLVCLPLQILQFKRTGIIQILCPHKTEHDPGT